MANTTGIDINLTKVLTILIGVVVASVIGYLIYKHFKTKREEDNVRELFSMPEFTYSGIMQVINKIPYKDQKTALPFLRTLKYADTGDMIYSAPGWFNDDEDRIYDAIASMRSKAGLAYLSMYFKRTYGTPLLTFLQDFMNNEELSHLYEIIKKMPAYLK